MKRLNNKGYMLVEIILAFALAMSIMYFVSEITIKIKNKNDELLVKTLTSTDQAIIYNMIMNDVYDGNHYDINEARCNFNNDENIWQFSYKDKNVFLNKYIDDCKTEGNEIKITVNALQNEDFDVVIPHD